MSTCLMGLDPRGHVVQQEAFYTVAFPDIAADDMRWMQLFREQHDPQHKVVAPHFTLVFGIHDLSEGEYLDHVAGVARSAPQVHFTCRYAMVGADDADDIAYVFLVPDEGNAAISRLHDRLYGGTFKRFLTLAIPYIPHITIASMKDFVHAKALCDALNERKICVEGRISALIPGVLGNGHFDIRGTYALACEDSPERAP
jgi:hypothetical protein